MNSTKIHPRTILIGPLPPPHNGQNMAFGMAIQLFVEKNLPHLVINIADRTYARADGQFTWARVNEIWHAVHLFLRAVWRQNQLVYLTNAQTTVGFLRDSIFIWLAALCGHRLVLHLHGGGYKSFFAAQPSWLRQFIVATLQRAHMLIVEGAQLKEQYSFLPHPHPPIVVVHNPPAEDIAVPETQIASRNADQPLRILYLSNLIESKGYGDVLDAVRLLHQRGLQIEAHFCGAFLKASDSAPDYDPKAAEAKFVTQIRTYGLEEMVTYHGVVKGEEKAELLRAAHIFVLPSYYVNEGQPVSIVEALANGLVIIATAYRGIVDLVKEGENGFFVPPRDPATIAERLEQLYHDPQLCARMGEASKSLFCRSFDRQSVGAALLAAIFADDAEPAQ